VEKEGMSLRIYEHYYLKKVDELTAAALIEMNKILRSSK
jgi:hypothetical protein